MVEAVDGERLAIKVSDEGVGISPVELKRIFNRFYRIPATMAMRAKGSGLGLFIVRSVAEHGGRAYAESKGPGAAAPSRCCCRARPNVRYAAAS